MTDRGNDEPLDRLLRPVSAKVMPEGQTRSGSGREMTDATKLRAQRQQAFARRQRNAEKGGRNG
jgi:hypothetical protein